MGPLDNSEQRADNQEIIYQVPDLPEESGEQYKVNQQLLCDNLELILSHSDLVLRTPEYFHIRHQWSHIGDTFSGEQYIPLGVLIKLWHQRLWLGECTDCGGHTYIYRAGGFPLSGRHFIRAICPACKKFIRQELGNGLCYLMKPARELCNYHIQKRKILRTQGITFSWSKGVVGEHVPDKVLSDVIEPVTLRVLVERLRQRVV